MNHLNPEQRAALYEQALELSERTGQGVEHCMVMLQNKQEIEQAWQQLWDQVKQLLQPVFDVVIEQWAQVTEVLKALEEQLNAPLQTPRCPSHGCELKGGRCPRCEMHLVRRQRGFQ